METLVFYLCLMSEREEINAKEKKETQGKRQSSYQRIPHNVCWSPGLWALLSDLLPESGGWKEGDIASWSEV